MAVVVEMLIVERYKIIEREKCRAGRGERNGPGPLADRPLRRGPLDGLSLLPHRNANPRALTDRFHNRSPLPREFLRCARPYRAMAALGRRAVSLLRSVSDALSSHSRRLLRSFDSHSPNLPNSSERWRKDRPVWVVHLAQLSHFVSENDYCPLAIGRDHHRESLGWTH